MGSSDICILIFLYSDICSYLFNTTVTVDTLLALWTHSDWRWTTVIFGDSQFWCRNKNIIHRRKITIRNI